MLLTLRNAVTHLPALVCAIAMLSSCTTADSPETQVRTALTAMEAAAEARDVGGVMALVAQDFRDAYGQDRDELNRNLYGYFIANQSIHLLTRINQISFPAADEARLQVTVGMVGREAAAASAWDLAADVYDFNVTMRKKGDEWQVLYAEWKRN